MELLVREQNHSLTKEPPIPRVGGLPSLLGWIPELLQLSGCCVCPILLFPNGSIYTYLSGWVCAHMSICGEGIDNLSFVKSGLQRLKSHM